MSMYYECECHKNRVDFLSSLLHFTDYLFPANLFSLLSLYYDIDHHPRCRTLGQDRDPQVKDSREGGYTSRSAATHLRGKAT
jgi:hypothetical protein